MRFASLPSSIDATRKPVAIPRRSLLVSMRAWLELIKPVTWMPVVCAYLSGAISSRDFDLGVGSALDYRLWLGFALSGPLISGTCQAMNDYFDRDLDAINEPYRPIPSGRVGLREATVGIAVLCILTLVTAYALHPGPVGWWIVLLSVVGIVNAHLYSARPIKLKRVPWVGNGVVAVSYILLPWMAGMLTFSTHVGLGAVVVGLCYVVASIGSMTTNDFKSIEGDRRLGIHTLPQVYGIKRAARLAVIVLNAGQFLAAIYLIGIGKWAWGLAIVGTVLPQIWYQRAFLRDPIHRDVWYNAHAQGFLVLGMFLAALAIR